MTAKLEVKRRSSHLMVKCRIPARGETNKGIASISDHASRKIAGPA
jgi:hypothetical protein